MKLPGLCSRRLARTLLVIPLGLFALIHVAAAQEHWVATWAAAPQQPIVLAPPPAGSNSTGPVFRELPGLHGQTVRMVARASLGGSRVRIRLSNLFGKTPLMVGSAHVALHGKDSGIVPGSDRAVSFSGKASCTIPPGALIVSDPVDLDVAPLADLAVSIYVPGDTGTPTIHALGLHTTYVSAAGDFTGRPAIADATTSLFWYWLTGVDVLAPANAAAIVTFGDSITDGATSTPDANRSWPSALAQRLTSNAATKNVAVVNEGISGNRLLHDTVGPNALARFDRDVLGQPGVRWLTVLEGINDIGFPVRPNATPGEDVTADDVIGALRQIVERAHLHGIKVLGGTLTPFSGAAYYSEKGETIREAVNRWIRSGGAFDAVVDFDAVVRDPEHPTQIRADFNIADHLHPNDAGYKAMADAIDLAIFSANAH
jgi:lysophospholipase L1-like esterase